MFQRPFVAAVACAMCAFCVGSSFAAELIDLGKVSGGKPVNLVKEHTFSQYSALSFTDYYTFEVTGPAADIGMTLKWSNGRTTLNGQRGIQELLLNGASLYKDAVILNDAPDGGVFLQSGTLIASMEEDTHAFHARSLQAGQYAVKVTGYLSEFEPLRTSPGAARPASYSLNFRASASPAPEAGDLAMTAVGLGGVALMLRRARQRVALPRG